VTPSDHEPDACGGSLFYAAGVHADRIGRLDVDTGEHHDRLQAEVAAASSQLLRLRRGSVGCNDGHTIRFLLVMGSAQTHVPVSRGGDTRQRSLQRNAA